MCLFFVQLRRVVMRSPMSAGFAQAQASCNEIKVRRTEIQIKRTQIQISRNEIQMPSLSANPSFSTGYHRIRRAPDPGSRLLGSPRLPRRGIRSGEQNSISTNSVFRKGITRGLHSHRGFVEPAPALSGGGAGAWTSVTKRRKDWPRLSGVAEPRDATDVIAFEEFGRPGRRVFGPRRPEPANRIGAPDRRAPN